MKAHLCLVLLPPAPVVWSEPAGAWALRRQRQMPLPVNRAFPGTVRGGASREGLAGGAGDRWRRREQLLPSTEQHVLFILGGFLTSQCEYFGRDCLFYIWIGVGTSCCSCVCVHAVVTRRDRLPSPGTGGWSWRNSFPPAAFPCLLLSSQGSGTVCKTQGAWVWTPTSAPSLWDPG